MSNFILNILEIFEDPAFLETNDVVFRFGKGVAERMHPNATVFADPFESPFPLASAKVNAGYQQFKLRTRTRLSESPFFIEP
jgi:hypothetical protein